MSTCHWLDLQTLGSQHVMLEISPTIGVVTEYCSVKSYVTGPLVRWYFNEFQFMWVLEHDK